MSLVSLTNQLSTTRRFQCHLFPITSGRFEYTFRARLSRLPNNNGWIWYNKPNNNMLLFIHPDPVIRNFLPSSQWLKLVYKWFLSYTSYYMQDPSVIYIISLLGGFTYYCTGREDKSKQLIELLMHSLWIHGSFNVKRVYLMLYDESYINISNLMNSMKLYIPNYNNTIYLIYKNSKMSSNKDLVSDSVLDLLTLALPGFFVYKKWDNENDDDNIKIIKNNNSPNSIKMVGTSNIVSDEHIRKSTQDEYYYNNSNNNKTPTKLQQQIPQQQQQCYQYEFDISSTSRLLLFDMLLDLVSSITPCYITEKFCHIIINTICLPISPHYISYLQKIICSIYSKSVDYYQNPNNNNDNNNPSNYILDSLLNNILIYCETFSSSVNSCVNIECACTMDSVSDISTNGTILSLLLKIITQLIKHCVGDTPMNNILNYRRNNNNNNGFVMNREHLHKITKTLLHIELNLEVSHPDYIRIMENILLITKYDEIEANNIALFILNHWPVKNSMKVSMIYRFLTSSFRIMKDNKLNYTQRVIEKLQYKILYSFNSSNIFIIQTTLKFIDCEKYSIFWDALDECCLSFPFINKLLDKIEIINKNWNYELQSYGIKVYNLLREKFVK